MAAFSTRYNYQFYQQVALFASDVKMQCIHRADVYHALLIVIEIVIAVLL